SLRWRGPYFKEPTVSALAQWRGRDQARSGRESRLRGACRGLCGASRLGGSGFCRRRGRLLPGAIVLEPGQVQELMDGLADSMEGVVELGVGPIQQLAGDLPPPDPSHEFGGAVLHHAPQLGEQVQELVLLLALDQEASDLGPLLFGGRGEKFPERRRQLRESAVLRRGPRRGGFRRLGQSHRILQRELESRVDVEGRWQEPLPFLSAPSDNRRFIITSLTRARESQVPKPA